ncbi:MAG: GNAT family N-acetyltransferase [Bacteroidetes bacterium]|nr:GNAT family N-acetyltransferase [Bacteroidota bacterium]
MLKLSVDEQLHLRTYTIDDAPALFSVINENRAHLRRWFYWVDSTTKEKHSLAFIQQAQAALDAQEGMALGIFHHNTLIGGVGMLEWKTNLKKAQVGYWIAKPFEGKGIVFRCLKVFISYLFQSLDLNKIEIHFIAENDRSAAVAQRIGARIEGVLRESYWMNGRLEDLVIAGILKREWTNNLLLK